MVREGIIKYLADFLVLLSVPCRVSYLPLLNDLLQSANPLNWRLRQSLALQLPRLMDLLPAQNLFGTLFPLTMSLLQDPVFQVRRASYDGVVRMVMVLYINLESPLLLPPQSSEDESIALENLVKDKTAEFESSIPHSNNSGVKYLAAVARAINALTFSESYQERQAWGELSLKLLQEIPQHIFELYFVEGLIQLASDPVPNVRVAAAETLSGWDPYDYAPWETPPAADDVNSTAALTTVMSSLSRSHSEEGSGHKSDLKVIVKRTDRPCPWKWLLARDDIHDLVQRLAQEDRDVFQNIKKLQPMFPLIEFGHISCRGLHVAPGGPSPLSNRDRTFSMEERLLSQPAVSIDRRNSRANSESHNAAVTMVESKEEELVVAAEGVDEMAPWAKQLSTIRDNVDEESIEKMFDIPSPMGEERNRFHIPVYNDDEDISPIKVALKMETEDDVTNTHGGELTSAIDNESLEKCEDILVSDAISVSLENISIETDEPCLNSVASNNLVSQASEIVVSPKEFEPSPPSADSY